MNSVYYDQELYHHGILKQRWGKRNGPPYPLKNSQKSSAERKAAQSAGETAKGMSDDELRSAASRTELENKYIKAMNDRRSLEKGIDPSKSNNGGNGNEFPENAELRKKVEKIKLQNKYAEEMSKYNESQKSKAEQYIRKFLDATIDGVVTAGSKAAIAAIVDAFNASTKQGNNKAGKKK